MFGQENEVESFHVTLPTDPTVGFEVQKRLLRLRDGRDCGTWPGEDAKGPPKTWGFGGLPGFLVTKRASHLLSSVAELKDFLSGLQSPWPCGPHVAA